MALLPSSISVPLLGIERKRFVFLLKVFFHIPHELLHFFIPSHFRDGLMAHKQRVLPESRLGKFYVN